MTVSLSLTKFNSVTRGAIQLPLGCLCSSIRITPAFQIEGASFSGARIQAGIPDLDISLLHRTLLLPWTQRICHQSRPSQISKFGEVRGCKRICCSTAAIGSQPNRRMGLLTRSISRTRLPAVGVGNQGLHIRRRGFMNSNSSVRSRAIAVLAGLILLVLCVALGVQSQTAPKFKFDPDWPKPLPN